MKFFAMLITALLIIFNLNIVLADVAPRFDRNRYYQNAIIDGIKAEALQDEGLINLEISFDFDCNYEITIYNDLIDTDTKNYPSEAELIKKISGTYKKGEMINEKFKYNSPDEDQAVKYLLVVSYSNGYSYRNTRFGRKRMKIEDGSNLKYNIFVEKINGKDSVSVEDFD